MIKILIAEPDDFSEKACAALARVGEVVLKSCSREELSDAMKEYDVVWFRLAHCIDGELLGDHPRCRILATPVTGLDHIDLEACATRGIKVISLKGEVDFLKQIRATAELTVALTLSLLRRLSEAEESVRHGVWNRDLFRGRELFGKTAGIVGVGRLGSIVAGYFKAFGMRVVGYDPRPDYPTDVAERIPTLKDLLMVADVVSLHVSYSESTRAMIGHNELAAMKQSAILVNTSRGGVIDEEALVKALEGGTISGAALDVVSGEPSVSPMHPALACAKKRRNLLITPHIGGNTSESFAKTEIFLAKRVADAVAQHS